MSRYVQTSGPVWRDMKPPPLAEEEATRSLREAHTRMLAEIWPAKDRGAASVCPCCDRYVAAKPRTINAEIARTFVRVAATQLETRLPVALEDAIPGAARQSSRTKHSSDVTYTKHWRLLQTVKKGVHWITPRGMLWAFGAIRVPRWVLLYDNRLTLAWSPELITLAEGLAPRDRPLMQLLRNAGDMNRFTASHRKQAR